VSDRLLVLVNGLPGAGKTTLARPLAQALRTPLLSKDAVKESMAARLASDGIDPRSWNKALSGVAMDVIWTILADMGGRAVVDANLLSSIRPFAVDGLKRAGFDVHETVEVWCSVPAAVARARFEARAGTRHPVHGPQVGLDDLWSQWTEQATPLGLGRVITVDTTRPVDVAALLDEVTEFRAPRPRIVMETVDSDV
jgi:predicted kinase